jgi:hypothetical protein
VRNPGCETEALGEPEEDTRHKLLKVIKFWGTIRALLNKLQKFLIHSDVKQLVCKHMDYITQTLRLDMPHQNKWLRINFERPSK